MPGKGRSMIRLERSLREALEARRVHPRETYEELIDVLYDELTSAPGRAGMDGERFLEALFESYRTRMPA
ncbi:MAG: hypothetical protein QXW06_05395 [Thermoplasmata archaeon]